MIPAQGADKYLEQRLRENGIDSLVHAIEHFVAFSSTSQARDLKFAILHLFHATDLSLKACLATISHDLVFTDPTTSKPGKRHHRPHTVSYDTAIKRLKTNGVELGSGLTTVNALQDVRNDIEHYYATLQPETVTKWISDVVIFLEDFLACHLNTLLHSELEQRLPAGTQAYSTVINDAYARPKRLAAALSDMEQFHDSPKNGFWYERLECPFCEEMTVLYPEPRSTNPSCFFCKRAVHIHECGRCGSATALTSPMVEDDYTPFCDNCWESIMSRD